MSDPTRGPAEEFFRRCWDVAREGREIDGSDVQEWGEELRLLERVRALAACGDGCVCAEWDEFPTDCYRPTPPAERA